MSNLILAEAHVKAARDVLGWAGLPGGWATGTFTSLLIEASMHADATNFAKLRAEWPELIHAVNLYKNTTNGIVILQNRAG